jgi:hypothetical protein
MYHIQTNCLPLQCFQPGIDIEDDVSLIVRYDTGATMSYHLVRPISANRRGNVAEPQASFARRPRTPPGKAASPVSCLIPLFC